MNIGEKLRTERNSRKITLAAIAEDTNFSKSYISQIERGLVNPSVSALQKIAHCLGLPTAYFFENQAIVKRNTIAAKVVKKCERKGLVYPGSNNVFYQLLAPDLQRKIEMLMIVAPPNSVSGEEAFIHEGEECGVVLEGSMEVIVGEERYVLEAGDSIYYDSSVPHRWSNLGDDQLIAIWSVTPPSF